MRALESASQSVRERVLSFEGGCNFRDIGGYLTAEGQLVRWGRVYRAGVLSYFTSQDRTALKNLDVRAICDFRREEERRREPTRWPDETTRTLSWQDRHRDADDVFTPTLRAFAARHPQTAAGMFAAMIELYRALPAWMSARIGGMFSCLAQGRHPLLVHCAAGKDRTGIAVAVLLRVLGVPYQAVVQDYLLTNTCADFETFIRTRDRADLGVTDIHHPLLAMPDDVRRVLFSADAQFLDAAFEQIEDSLGGLDRYLESSGVTASMLEQVRAALLMPAQRQA